MLYCELCGERIKGLSSYSCRIIPNQKKEVTLCSHCASCFNARLDDDEKKLLQFVNWSDNLIKQNRLYEPYLSQMIQYNKKAKEKIEKYSENDSQNNATSKDNLTYSSLNNYSNPVSVYSNNASLNIWIRITKVIGYLGIIGFTLIGCGIGSQINHLLLGGIAGFIIGMCSCSFIMMIASLCEDISEIKNRLR